MAADLQRFVDERPITARRTSGLERTRRWTRRNRALATALVAVFCLLLMLAAGSTSVAWRLSTEAIRNRSALYARDIRLAQTSLERGDRLAVEKTLLSWVPLGGGEDLRDFEWYYLWNLCHPSAIERTISHELYAYAVEFASDDGGFIASGWWNPTVDIWDWRDRSNTQPMQRLRQEVMGIHQLVRVPEKNWLLSGDDDGNVVIWDLAKAEQVETFRLGLPENDNRVNSISVGRDYRFVAVSAGHGYVHVWDRSNRSWVAKMDERPGRCRALFLDDDHLVIVSQESECLEVWRADSWTLEAKHKLDADGVTAIALSPERAELAVATTMRLDRRIAGRVDIWDVNTWKQKTRRSLQTGRVRSMDYSANGRFLATGRDDHVITLTDLDTSEIRFLEGMHAGNINSVALSTDGHYLATASQDKQVHIWNTSKLWRPSPSRVPLHTDRRKTLSMRFADQDQVVCGSQPGGRVIIWNASDGGFQDSFKVDWDGSMVQLEVHEEKSLAAISCGYWPPQWNSAGKVVLWDLKKNGLHSEYEIANGIYYSESSFSPCGRYVAVCSKNDVVVIDVETRRIHRQIGFGGSMKSVDFSDDGRWLACANWGRGTVHLLNTDGFEERRTIVADAKGCSYVAFSPDSDLIAAGGTERRLKLFDVQSGQMVREFGECPSYIVSIDFLPNGRRVAAASADGEIRVYGTRSGEDLLRFEFPNDAYPTTRFSSDGSSLLLADYQVAEVLHADTSSRLSRLSVARLKDIACRNFVHAKWVHPKNND